MAKIIMHKLFSIFIAAFLLVSCNGQSTPIDVATNPTSESWRCGLMEESGDQLELFGEWKAEFNASSTDTLFINNNGYYAQQFTDTSTGYQYKSESNRWYLEEVPGGGIYIHLEDMLDCESFARCVNPDSIGLDFYDFCGDKWFSFDHEFILSVVRDSEIARGFHLRRLQPAGCEGCFENYYFVDK